jgi:hypothetical protein
MSVAHEFLMLWLVPGGVKGKKREKISEARQDKRVGEWESGRERGRGRGGGGALAVK